MSEITMETNEKLELTIEGVLQGATQSKSKSISRASVEAGVLSIINAKTGTRLVFAATILEELGNPEELQISFDENKKTIIVGEHLLGNENRYGIKKSGIKGTIYCKNLVEEITEAMNLDFSGITSITLKEVEYIKNDEDSIAIIKVEM